MSDELRIWLSQELKRRGWSYRELSRRAGISQALISRILGDNLPPSADFCLKISKTLDEPPEKLLRLANILPAEFLDDTVLQELVDIAKNLPPEDLQDLLKYARFRFQQERDALE